MEPVDPKFKQAPGVDRTNSAVARITGLSRHFFVDKEGHRQEESMAAPSPLDSIKSRSQPHEERQRVYEDMKNKKTPMRGDNAAYQYDVPHEKATPSQEEPIPDHEMPSREADGEMYGAKKQDAKSTAVASKQASESNRMKSLMKTLGTTMEDYREFAGLPAISEGHSGEVPTAGVNKDNKMKAGLAGLQGQALQAVDPEDGHEENVGDAKEMTLDQAIAMLKKEGIDTDELWAEFLEQRGLTVELFNQLVDEAIAGDDQDEMDALIRVEGLFMQALPQMLPEGIMDMFRKKQQPDQSALLARTKASVKGRNPADIRAANARGVHVDTVVPLMKKKVAAAPAAGGDSRFTRSLKPTRRLDPVTGEDVEVNADEVFAMEDKMLGLASKYLPEEKWIQKAVSKHKGLLHKKLGVPQGKKIPAKKLNAAAKKGGKLGKEANLAKTLKKINKK